MKKPACKDIESLVVLFLSAYGIPCGSRYPAACRGQLIQSTPFGIFFAAMNKSFKATHARSLK